MAIFAVGERYHHGHGLLYRSDPRVKIMIAVLFAFGVTLVPDGDWPAYASFGLVATAAIAISRLPPLLVIRRSMIALPFVAAAVPLIFTREGDVIASVPILGWTVSTEGLVAVASIVLTSWLAVLMAVVLTSCTQPVDLIRGLERLRVPRVLASTIFFMYRYLFVIGAEGQRMLRARDARSAMAESGSRTGGSVIWRGRILGAMVGSLFIRSFERSERIYAAMQARGYDGSIRFADDRSLARSDHLLLGAAVALIGGLVLYARL